MGRANAPYCPSPEEPHCPRPEEPLKAAPRRTKAATRNEPVQRKPDPDWNRWAQALSDAPAADPSLYFWLEPGTSRTLDVIFSHTYIPAGKFALRRDGKASPNWRLYLNCAGNGYYQRGITSVTETIDATASWLARIVSKLDVDHVRTIGVSMGAAAALLFGDLVSADRIIAVGPEIVLGGPHDRSFIWCAEKFYDARYRDLTSVLKSVAERACIVFPAYDIADFIHIRQTQDAGYPHVVYLHAFHSGGQWLDWPRILNADGDIAFPHAFTTHPAFDFDYAPQALKEGEAPFASICARDFGKARDRLVALSAQKSNPGLMAQAAAQSCLLGDDVAAGALLDRAKAAHRSAYAASGMEAPEAFSRAPRHGRLSPCAHGRRAGTAAGDVG